MTTGIRFTSSTGAQFWHPCRDAKSGFAEMQSAAFTYDKGWGDPASKVEFGTDDGTGFTPTETVVTGWTK